MSSVLFVGFLAVSFSLTSIGQTQNLLEDGGFEIYKKCPSQPILQSDTQFPLRFWQPFKGTTPDYFNLLCPKAPAPKTFFGFQNPIQGAGYIGLANTGIRAEYVQAELHTMLEKDSLYFIEFYCSLGDDSKHTVNNVGIALSNKRLSNPNSGHLKLEPAVFLKDFLMDSINWVHVSGIYRAMGDERFAVIGVMGQKVKYKRLKPKKRKGQVFSHWGGRIGAYVLIDDVYIGFASRSQDRINQRHAQTSNEVEANEINTRPNVFELGHLTFDHNSDILKPDVMRSLDSLIIRLSADSPKGISVIGHTDASGSTDYNVELSLRRAKAVADYLSSNGLAEVLITTEGKGSTQPKFTSEDGVLDPRNRRVEIMIEY